MFAEKSLIDKGVEILKYVGAEMLSAYKGGGEVRTLILPHDADKFAQAFRFLIDESEDPYILGGGSDTLIADGVVNRPALSTAGLNFIEFDGDLVTAGAGTQIGKIIAAAAERGLGGLEFLAGVPATLGGALRMNAGAFGRDMGGLFVSAQTLGPETGAISQLYARDLVFGYRKGIDGIVLSAKLQLERCDTERIRNRLNCFSEQRKFKQPSKPSLGSVFKNPVNGPSAGRLIECAGLKGASFGGAKISEKHANFIINSGGGSAEDYLALATLAAARVESEFGIALTREFQLFCDK